MANLDRAIQEEARREHDRNIACAFAFDIGRPGILVSCYWCGLNLGSDRDDIKTHTADCPKRPPSTHEVARIAAAVAAEREETAKLRTEVASLRMALGCAAQNATFALSALKNPKMDGGHVAKARGLMETIKSDAAAELARGTP
jgi:hypothetical protein